MNGNDIDVTNLDHLRAFDNDDIHAIIHLAAKSSVMESYASPYETYRTNILGTLNVLELARLKKVRSFVFLSTYLYGQPSYLPVDENHPIDAISPYHRSKLIGEQLCKDYSDNYGIDTVILRAFLIYGPNSRSYHFIPSIIRQIKERKKVTLSGQKTRRDFLYIDDFVTLIVRILSNFPRGYNLYNVGYGKSYSLVEVSQMLAKMLDKKISIEYDEKIRPNDVNNMVADISKVSNAFKWRPLVSMEKGLASCVGNSFVNSDNA